MLVQNDYARSISGDGLKVIPVKLLSDSCWIVHCVHDLILLLADESPSNSKEHHISKRVRSYRFYGHAPLRERLG